MLYLFGVARKKKRKMMVTKKSFCTNHLILLKKDLRLGPIRIPPFRLMHLQEQDYWLQDFNFKTERFMKINLYLSQLWKASTTTQLTVVDYSINMLGLLTKVSTQNSLTYLAILLCELPIKSSMKCINYMQSPSQTNKSQALIQVLLKLFYMAT